MESSWRGLGADMSDNAICPDIYVIVIFISNKFYTTDKYNFLYPWNLTYKTHIKNYNIQIWKRPIHIIIKYRLCWSIRDIYKIAHEINNTYDKYKSYTIIIYPINNDFNK